MAVNDHHVVLSPRIFLAEFDISGDLNSHSINWSQELKEDNSYGDTFKQRKLSLQDTQIGVAGWVDHSGATDSETAIDSKKAAADVPLIFTNITAALGDSCEFGLVDFAQYQKQAQQGEVYRFDLSAALGSRRWIRGKILWSPNTSVTGTANGAEVSLGAVSATQKLYVAMAVFLDNFTSLDVKVQSDTTGFPSATDRVTFANATGVTSEMPAPVSGAITDTFWRASVSGFTGTNASIIVVAGIALP